MAGTLASDVSISAFLLLTVGLAALGLAVYWAVVFASRLRARRSGRGRSEVGFVVDTFHGLVSRLKEKERELEALREKAEERAGIVEGYNENILQSVPSGVVSMDGSGRIVKVNSAAERILGLTASEAVGRPGRDVFPGEFLDGPHERGESRFVTPSGKTLWLGYTLTPLKDAGGRDIGQLLVFTDLTELKALESQAELRKRLSSLGEMSAGMAHELRNPMGVISGYMRLLGKKTDGEVNRTVQAVAREVEAMDRIISDFLSFARPNEPVYSDVDLCALLGECVSGLAGALGGVEVSVEAGGPLFAEADPVLLRQAVVNLLRNAREATEDGGSIRLSCAPRGASVEISVRDSGHGVAEGMRERIFLPFYTTKGKGTGLGLAIVHGIATAHGGAVSLTSGDWGSEFTITLPLERPGRRRWV